MIDDFLTPPLTGQLQDPQLQGPQEPVQLSKLIPPVPPLLPDPKLAAKQAQMKLDSGFSIPTGSVLDTFEMRRAMERAYSTGETGYTPRGLQAFLNAEPSRVTLMRPSQFEDLIEIEEGFWSSFAAAVGQSAGSRPTLAAEAAIFANTDPDNEEKLKELLDEFAAQGRRASFLTPGGQFVGEALGQLARSLGIGVGAGAAVSAVATPVAGAAAAIAAPVADAATTVFGLTYLEMRSRDIDHETAWEHASLAAAGSGLIDLATARIYRSVAAPLSQRLLPKSTGAQRFLQSAAEKSVGQRGREFLSDMLQETVGEGAQEFLEGAITDLGVSRGRPADWFENPDDYDKFSTMFEEGVGDLLSEAAMAAAQAAFGVGVYSGTYHGLAAADDAKRIRAGEQSQQFYGNLKRAGAAVRELNEVAPGVANELLATQVNTSIGRDSLWIDAKQLRATLQAADEAVTDGSRVSDEFAKIFPEVAEKLDRAASRGETVQLDIATYAAKVANGKLEPLLRDHLQLSPDAPSGSVAKRMKSEAELRAQVEARNKKNKAWRESHTRAWDSWVAQNPDFKKLSADSQFALRSVFTAHMLAMTRQSDTTPDVWLRENPFVRIRLGEDGTFTPSGVVEPELDVAIEITEDAVGEAEIQGPQELQGPPAPQVQATEVQGPQELQGPPAPQVQATEVQGPQELQGPPQATQLSSSAEPEIGQPAQPQAATQPADGALFPDAVPAPREPRPAREAREPRPKAAVRRSVLKAKLDGQEVGQLRAKVTDEATTITSVKTPTGGPLSQRIFRDLVAKLAKRALKENVPLRAVDVTDPVQVEFWERMVKAKAATKTGKHSYESAGEKAQTILLTKGQQFLFSKKADKTPRAKFDMSRLLITFFETDDPAAVLHELGHFFLHQLSTMAARANADPAVTEQMETLLKWFGVESLAKWNSMDVDEQRVYHEQFAVSFEMWLHEGVAPVKGLRRIFESFRAMISRVYRSMLTLENAPEALRKHFKEEFGRELPPISPEVRAVFGSILTSEVQVLREEARRRFLPDMIERDEFVARGLGTPEDYDRLEAAADEARETAIQKATRAALQSTEWVRKKMRKQMSTRKRLLAKKRDERIAELTPQIERLQVHRARRYFRTGVFVDTEGVETQESTDTSHFKLDSLELRSYLQPAVVRRLGKMTKQGGLRLSVAAQMFGYDGVPEMLRDLIAAPTVEQQAREQAGKEVAAENPELIENTGEFNEAINLSVVDEARSRYLELEMRLFGRMTEPVTQVIDAADQLAQAELRNVTIDKIGYVADTAKAASAQAREAQKKELKSRRKASAEKAAEHLKVQLLQTAREREALHVKREVERAMKKWRSRYRGALRHLGTTRSFDRVMLAMDLLGRLGFETGTSFTPEQRAEMFKQMDPDLVEYHEDAVTTLLDGRDDVTMDQLTVDQFRVLVNVIEALDYTATEERRKQVEEQETKRTETLTQLIAQADTRKPALLATEGRWWSLVGNAIANWWTARGTMTHWADRMDGAVEGIFHDAILNPAYEAQSNAAQRREAITAAIVAADTESGFDKLPQYHEVAQINGRGMRHSELLGLVLSLGNPSNMQRAAQTLGFKPNDDATAEQQLMAEVQRLVSEGVIGEPTMQMAEAFWKQTAELLPDLEKAYLHIFGVRFPVVLVKSFDVTMPDGTTRTLTGGYVPALFDPLPRPKSQKDVAETRQGDVTPDRRASIEQLEAILRDGSATLRHQLGITDPGFAQEREKTRRAPLSFDPQRILHAVGKQANFAYIHPVLSDILKLYRNGQFQGALDRVNPFVRRGLLEPALERLGSQNIVDPLAAQDEAIARFFRQNAGPALLVTSMVNISENYASMAPALTAYGVRNVTDAAFESTRRPRRTAAAIMAKSGMMKMRLALYERSLSEDSLTRAVFSQSRIAKLNRARLMWSSRIAMFGQIKTQHHVDMMTWLAAYNHALQKNGDEQKAVKAADNAVLRMSGDYSPFGRAAAESRSEWGRLMSQFFGFFTNLGDYTLTRVVNANTKRAVTMALFDFAAIHVISSIIRSLWSESDDDDEEGAPQWVTDAIYAPVRALPATLGAPLISSVVQSMMDVGYTKTVGGTMRTRARTAPAFAIGERFVEALSMSTPSKLPKALLDMSGFALPPQVAHAIDRLLDPDYEESDSDLDTLRRWLTGKEPY